MTAEQVFEYITPKNPSISKATVYRNLSQMVEAGVLINIGNYFGAARYDCILHKHHHFVCTRCQKIFDMEGDFSAVIDGVSKRDGLDITDYNIVFSGICSDCKGK